ncbi:hypothetical protein CYMTET_49256 [Cymbomonas tetramitiformis]|uniref:Uncharacterized protein n=1 Tax=Cymbomonas tetramitiformis TaxID=36881 RepID=A0AAE0EUB7_9CHLO|nr:hypothetical protein CYMTET_49256 [Cymbomonas tetramitiformis]
MPAPYDVFGTRTYDQLAKLPQSSLQNEHKTLAPIMSSLLGATEFSEYVEAASADLAHGRLEEAFDIRLGHAAQGAHHTLGNRHMTPQ